MSSEMGILQHHDAITGTEQQHVADDYLTRVSNAFGGCDSVTNEAFKYKKSKTLSNSVVSFLFLSKLIPKQSNKAPDKINFVNCMLRNISECKITEYLGKFVVTVYNPLSRRVNYTVRFPVSWRNSQIIDPDGVNE